MVVAPTRQTGMGGHQSASMGKDEWLTPPWVLERLGSFDLDPCSPISRPWDTARQHYSVLDNGLLKQWHGRVWCNPPYGAEAAKWLSRCAEHGNAIALIFARTETAMFFRNVWNRADGLLELTNETRGKVIIWSRFVRSIEKIEEALAGEYGPESVVTYYGATEKEDRAGAIKRFQNDEKTRFFVGNQQTAGYGITLTVASTVIYFSNSFDLAARMQSEDRCHRIGQTKSVTYIDMVCPKTIDEKILKALKDKKNVSDLIMGKGDENFFM